MVPVPYASDVVIALTINVQNTEEMNLFDFDCNSKFSASIINAVLLNNNIVGFHKTITTIAPTEISLSQCIRAAEK